MKNLVIDGNSLLNRSFYGLVSLSNSEGQATGGIFGFLTTLHKLQKEENPDAISITFDLKGPTFRHLTYPEYKAGRHKMPPELASQFPLLKEILHAMSIPCYALESWEADDLMGTISRIDDKLDWETVLVTGDKDALQLVTEKTTVILLSSGSGGSQYKYFTPSKFQEVYGFPPIHLVDLKALMGDTSDNIPGILGVGEKTAQPLVAKYLTIDNIYNALEDPDETLGLPKGMLAKVRSSQDSVRLSLDLAEIRCNAPLDFHPDQALCKEYDQETLLELLIQLDLNKFIEIYGLQQLEEAHNQGRIGELTWEEVQDLARATTLLEQWSKDKENALAVLPLEGLSGFAVDYKQETSLFLESSFPEFGTFLQSFFTAPLKLKVQQSKTFLKQLLEEGISCESIVFDLQVGAYLLSPDSKSYDLVDLSKKYYHFTPNPAEDFTSEHSFSPLSDSNLAKETWVSHCRVLGILSQIITELLEKNQLTSLYQTIELPLCAVLAEMEQEGISLDVPALKLYGENLATELKELEQDIYRQAGEAFNLQSPQQLGLILFEKMDFIPEKKTKTGYSTNIEVLEKLQEKHPESQIISQIIQHRHLSKLHATYVKGLLKVVSPGQKIHSSFQNTVTATGRLSSIEPNLQNIPIRTPRGAELRHMFVASPGNVLIDADYSQIELRLLAHIAQDQAMIDAFLSGEDFHSQTASQVFHLPLSQVTSEMRRSAKAVNFGIVYGISPFSLSQDIGVTVAEAKQYIQRYFDTYPKVKEYLEQVVVEGKKNGYVSTVYGRKRWLPELTSSNFLRRSGAERIAQNMPIQGTAADLMKLAMVSVSQGIKAEQLQAKILLQVHDELILECPQDQGEQVAALVQREMEQVADFAVPLLAETQIGRTWGEAH